MERGVHLELEKLRKTQVAVREGGSVLTGVRRPVAVRRKRRKSAARGVPERVKERRNE